VCLMPNTKPLRIVREQDFGPLPSPPYKVCTFSRVMPEKGIQDAIDAVRAVNEQSDSPQFILDIYGELWNEQWFETLMAHQPDYIHYKGIVDFSASVDVLTDYFALLFPTRFKTEGFAGTILDAFAAGIPIIASDCAANKEIIKEDVTGKIFALGDSSALAAVLTEMADNPMKYYRMKANCVKHAKLYQPQNVIKTLTDNIDRE